MEAFASGRATTKEFDTLADMRDRLLLASAVKRDATTIGLCRAIGIALLNARPVPGNRRMGITGDELRPARVLQRLPRLLDAPVRRNLRSRLRRPHPGTNHQPDRDRDQTMKRIYISGPMTASRPEFPGIQCRSKPPAPSRLRGCQPCGRPGAQARTGTPPCALI